MIRFLPKVLYDSDGEKYYLHIYTERCFMFPDKQEYVFAYITDEDVFATKIQEKSLFVLCLKALRWVYCGSAKSWGMTRKNPKH